MLEAETNAEFGACRFQCFKSFRHDFFADTISGDNGDVVYVHCSVLLSLARRVVRSPLRLLIRSTKAG
jgi:hypothetical protein